MNPELAVVVAVVDAVVVVTEDVVVEPVVVVVLLTLFEEVDSTNAVQRPKRLLPLARPWSVPLITPFWPPEVPELPDEVTLGKVTSVELDCEPESDVCGTEIPTLARPLDKGVWKVFGRSPW